jgi:ABC-type glycerol-3-phosphate transport system substrate-binding protein
MNPFTGPRVIRVATFLGSDPLALTGSDRAPIELQRAANALNAQKPGYEVRVDFMMLPPRPTAGPPGSGAAPTPFAPTALTLEAAAAGGELAAGSPPPDLALVTSPGDLPALIDRKLIQPLDEALKTDRSFALEEFVSGALEAVRTRGKIGMLPLAGQVNVLLYDTALFESASLPPPARDWTWTALLESARRLTRETPDARHWGILAHNQVPLLLGLIWAHGGELIARDGRRSAIAEPAAREGIQFWTDLIQRHRVAPLPQPTQQLIQLQSPSEIGLTAVDAPSGAGAAANMFAFRLTNAVNASGQQVAMAPGQAMPGSRERAAMMLSNTVSSLLPGAAGQRRAVLAAEVPRARTRATQLSLTAGLALGAQAQDQKLALRAALALSDRLQQTPVSIFGLPVRKPDIGLLRRAQPALAEDDAAALASAMTYSRALAPELAPGLVSTIQQRLMGPLLANLLPLDEAIRTTASALDELLRG